MNKLIKSCLIFLAFLTTITIESCRKPRCPEDPCLNPVTVTALDTAQYARGHFSYTDNNNSMFWLYATNWSDFAGKVEPGRQYKIGYKEVQCKDMYYTREGIAAGGCFIPQRKCIVIKCLELIREKQGACFESLVNPPTFNDELTGAISSTGINGNSLNVKIGFSGCSGDNGKYFKLYLQHVPDLTMGPLSHDVFIAKAVNTFKEVTCMAYFEKDVCFDLSAIRTFYQRTNSGSWVPPQVIVRLMTNDNKTRDFAYKP